MDATSTKILLIGCMLLGRTLLAFAPVREVSKNGLQRCGAKLKPEEKETLRALGMTVAFQLNDLRRLFKEKEEVRCIVSGIRDVLNGKVDDPRDTLRVKEDEIKKIIAEKMAKSVAEEKHRGAVFAAQAAKQDGATVTPSGLVFQMIERGDSDTSPTVASTVSVHFTGMLIDGTIVDSSRNRGQPTQFTINQVIRGWQEGLLLMSEGDKAQLTIPSDLAYGDIGRSDGIPGGATLSFEVELVKVVS